MNEENNKDVFQCICGKTFDNKKSCANHKGRCKIYQTEQQKIKQQEKESRRLPNGMFKCENPDCGNEHDGSYGSGRFCCEKCRRHTTALLSAKTAIKNDNKKCPKNFKVKVAPYGTWKCKLCGEIFETRALLSKHVKLKHPNSSKRGGWNKGLTKETCQSIANSCLKISNSLKIAVKDGRLTGRAKTLEKEEFRKKKISNTMQKNPNAGGKRHGSGRGYQGYYKGIWCDSSWELAWVIYNLDHEITFTRYNGYFEYEFNGKTHKYYPDFQLEDGTIVEIKGYKTEQWLAKLEQFPKQLKLLVIGKNEIKIYLNYVIKQYGENFIKLYENGKLVELANTSALNTEVRKDMGDRDPHFPPFFRNFV